MTRKQKRCLRQLRKGTLSEEQAAQILEIPPENIGLMLTQYKKRRDELLLNAGGELLDGVFSIMLELLT